MLIFVESYIQQRLVSAKIIAISKLNLLKERTREYSQYNYAGH